MQIGKKNRMKKKSEEKERQKKCLCDPVPEDRLETRKYKQT